MTPLRQRRLEDLPLRGLSARTQAMDVGAVRQLAEPSHKSPHGITEEELRDDCLALKHVKPDARSASTTALGGLKCFFDQTLHREWTTLRCGRAPREKTLPVILRREAVRRRRAGVRLSRSRVCRSTIDACGLRRQAGTHLQGRASDSARLLVPVRHGKGGQARDVPLPHRTLARRRPSGVTQRHPLLIFPAPGRGGISRSTAPAPRPRSRVPGACREALQDRGLHTQASVHPRRHSWATQVLEAGVKLRLMHADLGHHAPTPTSVDTHPTARADHLGVEAIHRRMGALGWWRVLIFAASMALRTARPLATGGGPLTSVRGRTLSGAARRGSAARSLTGRPAESPLTATTPVRTGTVPRANVSTPTSGWHIRRDGGCRFLTAGSPSRHPMR